MYIKTYESLNKNWIVSTLDDDDLFDIYEYLFNINANPKIYKGTDNKYKIYYTDNKNLEHRFLVNRSTLASIYPIPMTLDLEKEKAIQLQLQAKKFNI